jgi:hypothetical protein
MKKIAFVSVVVSSLLLLSTTAQAAPPSKNRIQGASVVASFSSFDPLTCVNTSVSLSAYETEGQSSGAPVAGGQVVVNIYIYNDCELTESLAVLAFAEIAPGELQVNGPAHSATLQKSLVVHDDVSGSLVPLTIDLTWNANGEPTRSVSHQKYLTPTGRTTVHVRAVERNADVVGSISAGGTNVIANIPSAFSSISTMSSGTMTHN